MNMTICRELILHRESNHKLAHRAVPCRENEFIIQVERKKIRPMKKFAKVAGITAVVAIALLRFGSTENGRMKRL